MVRRNVISLFIFFSIASNASAQTCAGNPVAVQILGSGGPAINTERASAGYLLVKKAYTGALTVGSDLQCTPVQ